jgi:hypothetical protein
MYPFLDGSILPGFHFARCPIQGGTTRIILTSYHAVRILQHLDAVIIECLLGTKQDIEIALGAVYSTEALVLAKRIANMFQKFTGLDAGLFEELQNL